MIWTKYFLSRSIVKVKSENDFSCMGKIKNSIIKLYGCRNEIVIGKGANLRGCRIFIHGVNNKLIIGDECDLQNTSIFMDNNDGRITIGDKTSIGRSMLVSFEEYPVSIGRECMISYDVEIRNTDSHAIYSIKTHERVNLGRPVVISDRVWIGCGSMVLKGSKVGMNSIIGAKSIVSGKIPDSCVAVGNPAKPIKNDVCWERDLF